MTEDKMDGWHHQLNAREFEQTLGDGEGQGSLACCSPWGCRESDLTQQLNNDNVIVDSKQTILVLRAKTGRNKFPQTPQG